ncbi:MAG TPA: SDR family oxidoreductase [Acidimicrobiales bacterium]|jgi:NAD(P)-dependent dehydrogenase (short-subunit alcohol dehydrogenase family)|nr:SDR family oxidoreductase [Acidimicrobiales bacterium]
MSKVAVVSGGSAGVGRATVQLLARQGYDVAVLARGADGRAGAVAEVGQAGCRGLALEVDVSDHEAVNKATARVEAELGEIDAWVNVAFVGTLAFAWDTTVEEYRRVMDVTFHGQVNGTLAALSVMRPRDRGVIVNVGSAMAYRSIPLQAPYCAAKHAVVGFTESVMTELVHEKSKVKLCMVQLPGLNTPQFEWNLNKMPKHPMPVPPIYQPELAAKGIVHLVEHPRRNLWVGVPTAGTIIGERLAPKLLDLYLGRSGVKSQQTDPSKPRRGANLWEPQDADSDAGSHGPFDSKAHDHDPVLWAATHRPQVIGGLVAAAAIGAARLLTHRVEGPS